MSTLKFDFSDIRLVKMADLNEPLVAKKPALKKFKKPKFVAKTVKTKTKPQEVQVVTLSDSEDSKDPVEIIEPPPDDIISISESSDDENENPSIEIITLDDSVLLNQPGAKGNEKQVSNALDYIPIPNYASKKFKSNPNPKKRKIKELGKTAGNQAAVTKKARLFEHHKVTPLIKLSHTNIHEGTDIQQEGLRPIVIDGSNVACGYGSGKFHIKGVIIVIQYFLKRGHTDITCFLPAHFRHTDRTPEERNIILAYEKDGLINYTPSRKLNGKSITPYDDRFIVQYASLSGGVIISNDGYRDLYEEEPSWKETIEKRLINYTFVKDILMLPKDPLGRTGPSLDEILKFS